MTEKLTSEFFDFLQAEHIWMKPVYCIEDLSSRIIDINIRDDLTLSLDCDYEQTEIGLIVQYAVNFASENELWYNNIHIKLM